MKRTISALLVIILIIFSQGASLNVYAEGFVYYTDTKQIQRIAKELNELIEKYDADIEFTSLNEEDNTPITDDGVYTENDFITARLIIHTDKKINEFGAIEHIFGYDDIHILQYASPYAAVFAYNNYFNDSSIESIQPDININPLEEENSGDINPSWSEDWHSWGYDRIRTEDAFKYILSNKDIDDLPEIVVGVIDDGVGYKYGNQEFKNRVIKQYSFLGDKSQIDNGNHGAGVAGVIYENTLPNVKIISYQVFEPGKHYSSITDLGEAQAYLDGVDIMNCSYGGGISGINNTAHPFEREILESYPLRVQGAGNDSSKNVFVPKTCVSVGAIKQDDKLCDFSNHGYYVDIAAPGLSIHTTVGEMQRNFAGTSCSTPFAVSVCAMIMTQYPDFSKSMVAQVLFDSCEESAIDVRFGIINMFNAVTHFDSNVHQTATPQFSIESRPTTDTFYSEDQYVGLSCADENAEIYYTLDNTIPSKNNGSLYTAPIKLSTTSTVMAVAYSDAYYQSGVTKRTFYIRIPLSSYPNENGWHIRDNGMIWGYSGPDMNLVVPEKVLGIDVVGIESGAFENQDYILSITMPECLKTIEEKAFRRCHELTSVIAPGVETIGDWAFAYCLNLNNCEFPSLNEIGIKSFMYAGSLNGFPFERLEFIPQVAFSHANVINVNLAKAKHIDGSAFHCCEMLQNISMPVLESAGTMVFYKCTMLENIFINPDFEELEVGFFKNCCFTNVDFLPGVLSAYRQSFAYNTDLTTVNMPLLEDAGVLMFYNDSNLSTVNMPSLKVLRNWTFSNCSNLKTLNLSEDLEWIENDIFSGCDNLKYVKLYGEFLNQPDTFENSNIERLEMNKVKLLRGLPDTTNCVIAMPSTFSECTEETQGRNYLVYGSAGTYAEQWANENGHQFIEVCQDTAIVENIPEQYNGTKELSFDCIGFNRLYTWYGSNSADISNGVELCSESEGAFNPRDFDEYPYYYCKCTSVDRNESTGFEHTEIIYSRVCENTDYVELRGDVSQNGSIGLEDYLLVKYYLYGLEHLTEERIQIADINRDGATDAFDLFWIDKALNGLL